MLESAKNQYSFKYILFMWSILLFGYFLNFFHSLTTGILQPYLMKDFNIEALTITNIGSMYFYAYLFMQIPTGMLSDKFGVKKTVFFGLTMALLGTVCFAAATNVFMLYFGRTFIGIGTATIFVCILKFQIAWMKAQVVGTMTGIACFVGTLGGMVAQSPLVWLVENIGWRGSMYLIALATLANIILLLLFVKNSPQEASGNAKIEIEKKEEISVVKALISILLNPRTWPAVILYGAFYGSYVVIAGYSGTQWLINSYGIGALEASSYILFCIFGSAVGSIVVGVWSDKLQSRKIPMLATGAVYIVTWAILAYFAQNLSLMLIAALLFALGFFSCAFVVCWSCVQEINPKQYAGVAASVVNMGGFIGPIVLPYLYVFTQTSYADTTSPESFAGAFEMVFFAIAISYACSFFVKEPSKV